MKVKIVIEADIDVNEVKKNPVIRILKQLRQLDTSRPEPLPVVVREVVPVPDGILKF